MRLRCQLLNERHDYALVRDKGQVGVKPYLGVTRYRGDTMAEKKPVVLYAASYDSVSAALTDLDAIEQLHKDEMIGSYDAAVIDQENGKPHIVKRMDRPRIHVIPEAFGGGTLPRKELKEAAGELTASQAGLIAVGPSA